MEKGTIDRCFAGSLILGGALKINGWSTFRGKTSLRNMPLFYGPSFDLGRLLKQDVMAPGSNVLGAWVPNKSMENIGDNLKTIGTSYANLHVVGVVLVLKGAHSEWSPSAIRSGYHNHRENSRWML
ncbi:Peptidase S8, subtilisin-related [Trema orientale]|uniref:Peptidase S8, subtilisin-related n=1 Tax=Trema orientale TaxID=63057 RepID=A0A2P5FDD8_TREOI|nr:Peptidase S8, subtilisin-related [Trema orientale]